jgi:hypothetical protein
MSKSTLNAEAVVRAELVPYITNWSGEHYLRTLVITRGLDGIGYLEEQPTDRDTHGVLWAHCLYAPGEGEPQFKQVHPYRQRHAMRRLLCQSCGKPADRNGQGVLWLPGQSDQPWTGRELTGQPPICLPCARTASRICPHLDGGNTLALRVRRAPIAAVKGTVYEPAPYGPIPTPTPAVRLYTDPTVRMLQARQLLRDLVDCTVVDLEEELARSETP